jgi:hypothetical protein
MKHDVLFLFLFLCAAGPLGWAAEQDAPYRPLMLYQGTWQVTPLHAAKPDILQDNCGRTGKFYSCEQTVNGKTTALVVFVPAEQPGHYYTQALLPDGHATGRGDLEIVGDRWVYSSKDVEGAKTTYYRTINVFTGKDHIHFDSQESTDGAQWKTTNSGDEQRMPATKQ